MPSVNEHLRDQSIYRQVLLQRYSNGVVQKIIKLLNRSDDKLTAELYAALAKLPNDSFTVQRLNSLLKGVRDLNGKAYEEVSQGIKDNLLELVKDQADYQYDLFEHVIPIPVSISKVTPESVFSAAMARPFQISKDKAVPLNEYLAGLEKGRADAIRDSIRLGYINGQSIDQMVRAIRGTKTQNYADGLMEGSRRHVEGMVRTAVNHTSNFTQQRFYEANTGMIKGWQFLATLDSRVSLTCSSLSGKIFPVGKGPIPPLHINCRSFAVPVTKSWRELGIDMDEFKSTRSSIDGQISQDITFTSWLKGKPAAFQDDILGTTRGRLFRANEIEVDKFTNSKGKVYSLDELRRRNKELFQKAGLLE